MVETTEAPAREPGARLALAAFVAYLAVGFVAILAVLGRYRWFFWDEWDFLAARDGGSIDDLLRPHNEHLSTIPIVIWRALWNVFGLHSYVPYQAVTVAAHLTVVVLLRVVMRRVGVGPWIATLTASMLVLFGAGWENIIWAFQIGFVGSVAFGLGHLLLADHDGPLDRRDAFGLAAGLGALLCSGVGPFMVLAVGLSVLIRRGWRAAAVHTVPLAAAYAVWWVAIGQDHVQETDRPGPWYVVRWVGASAADAFDALGQVTGVGAVLALTLLVGLVVAWRPLDRAALRRRAAMPVSLLVGAVLFSAVAGWGRRGFYGIELAVTPRYVYLTAALALPALAVAVDAITRRWRLTFPVAVVLLLVGGPGNVQAFEPAPTQGEAFFDSQRALTLLVAHSDQAATTPRWVEPDLEWSPEMTVGWLLDGAASGDIPRLDEPAPLVESLLPLRLAVARTPGSDATVCETHDSPFVFTPERGTRIGLFAGATVQQVLRLGTGLPLVFARSSDHVLEVQADGMTLQLSAPPPVPFVRVCSDRSLTSAASPADPTAEPADS